MTVNHDVAGSSPAGGAIMNNLSSLGLRGYFFAFFGSDFTENGLLVSFSDRKSVV